MQSYVFISYVGCYGPITIFRASSNNLLTISLFSSTNGHTSMSAISTLLHHVLLLNVCDVDKRINNFVEGRSKYNNQPITLCNEVVTTAIGKCELDKKIKIIQCILTFCPRNVHVILKLASNKNSEWIKLRPFIFMMSPLPLEFLF